MDGREERLRRDVSAQHQGGRALLRRDLVLSWREGGAIGIALGFYLMVVAITPLGLGPDLNLLSRIAPGSLHSCRIAVR